MQGPSTHRKTLEGLAGVDRAVVDKNVVRSIVGDDKANTLLGIEPFDQTREHLLIRRETPQGREAHRLKGSHLGQSAC